MSLDRTERTHTKASEVQAMFLPWTGAYAEQWGTASTSLLGPKRESSISAVEKQSLEAPARLCFLQGLFAFKSVPELLVPLFISGQAWPKISFWTKEGNY